MIQKYIFAPPVSFWAIPLPGGENNLSDPGSLLPPCQDWEQPCKSQTCHLGRGRGGDTPMKCILCRWEIKANSFTQELCRRPRWSRRRKNWSVSWRRQRSWRRRSTGDRRWCRAPSWPGWGRSSTTSTAPSSEPRSSSSLSKGCLRNAPRQLLSSWKPCRRIPRTLSDNKPRSTFQQGSTNLKRS